MLPAAGTGSRLPDRELSKELLPYGEADAAGKPVIAHLLSCICVAGIRDVVVVLRQGKWDIPGYLAGGDWDDIRFTYKITRGTSSVPETAALGLQDIGARRVIFGFPDILFEPKDAFAKMIERLDKTNADVVLGLFPTRNSRKMDMVKSDSAGRVVDIEIKPDKTTLDLTWILAVWTPAFSTYLGSLVYDYPARLNELAATPDGGHLGHAFQLAMSDGLSIVAESFESGRCLDIGTPEDLALARVWK